MTKTGRALALFWSRAAAQASVDALGLVRVSRPTWMEVGRLLSPEAIEQEAVATASARVHRICKTYWTECVLDGEPGLLIHGQSSDAVAAFLLGEGEPEPESIMDLRLAHQNDPANYHETIQSSEFCMFCGHKKAAIR